MTKVTSSTPADKAPSNIREQKTDPLLNHFLSQSRFYAPAPSVFYPSGYYVPLGNQLRWGRFHTYKQHDTIGKKQQSRSWNLGAVAMT